LPAAEANEAFVFVEADRAVQVERTGEMAEFFVAHAALGALEMPEVDEGDGVCAHGWTVRRRAESRQAACHANAVS
jgi:hypothetical protein